jgi:hypothetical protein
MNRPQRQGQQRIRPAREGDRQRAIERVRRSLVRDGSPRLLVSFLLALTGASGFLVSAVLLHLGVTMMTVRYPLAVLSAYCVFLLLLRLWLALRQRTESDGGLSADAGDAFPHLLDAAASGIGEGTTSAAKSAFGGGADFGGAGAGGSWSGGAPGSMSAGMPVGAPGGMSGGSSSASMNWAPDLGLDVDLDLGEGCFWIIIPIAAIVGVIVAMFYVVYIAPVFLAEILVDALLVAGLYKRLKGVEPRHWLLSAVRRTLLPAVLATALFIAAGYLMGLVAPEARSIGEFWRQVNTGKAER